MSPPLLPLGGFRRLQCAPMRCMPLPRFILYWVPSALSRAKAPVPPSHSVACARAHVADTRHIWCAHDGHGVIKIVACGHRPLRRGLGRLEACVGAGGVGWLVVEELGHSERGVGDAAHGCLSNDARRTKPPQTVLLKYRIPRLKAPPPAGKCRGCSFAPRRGGGCARALV